MAHDCTVVGIALHGDATTTIHRRGDGRAQSAPAPTGAVWLCPEGVAEDGIRITGPIPRMLHVYLPREPFAALACEDGARTVDARSVLYASGVEDALIARLGVVIAAELEAETSAGRLLAQTATLTVAARLLHSHASQPYAVRPARATGALDERRLRRVVEHIEANLGVDVTLEALAAVACLSPFHFVRAFKAATGLPPHAYVARRRLERAKELLACGRESLAEIALASRFSSQASFTRAFRRAAGCTPGAYRRAAKGPC